MDSRKCSHETDLVIKIASEEPLKADSLLVRSQCDSARGLPTAAEVWDVSGLLLDGKPFSRATVSCWLSCAHSAIHGVEELAEQDKQQLSTVTGLTELLAFADAVGSYAALCKTACSQIQQLKFVVQLPEQTLELPLGTYTYRFDERRGWQLVRFNLQEQDPVSEPLMSAKQQQDVQQQVAKQLSALLQLAHMLRLQQLLDVLHQFILRNVWPGAPRLLSSVMGLVFSDAVLEAALGSSTLSKEAYINSVLSQPCSLTPGVIGHSSLLKPIGPRMYDARKDLLCFEAELLQDFAGSRAGDLVNVVLDLFGTEFSMGRVQIITDGMTSVVLPAQLLLGHNCSDAAALTNFLKPDAAA
jgi:hypothetical protein